MMPL
jgi:hypothetical protein